ncbi:response regulator [Paenibacillus sp. GSMTC-2017]|uniref:ATP-binding response regulator n=1 Tax=Paenibacillus sp. GSMTC-2017 TaxID=2794350 RepID=UPI0018D7F729|nr:response regulator [Paenibacillus sp. GSMTC-2017]MBH5318803.1 response regulator [Paenibacillus sp. GSMTC-2017]
MDDIDVIRRMLEREKKARQAAERIAEEKTREIYYVNQELRQLNDQLEELVKERTIELSNARDEAIEANQIKSQFLASMSHELRTPLNAIIGYSEMLKEDMEMMGEAVFADDLNKIHSAGRHLLTLINDILDLSKIEAGKMELYMEQCNIASVIHDIVTTVRPLMEVNKNEIKVECTDGSFKTDVTKLRQMLFNLLSNASKFTKDGTITLQVLFESVAGMPGIAFRVHDTGIGMTSDQLDQVFQAFKQADSSTTKKYGGTGLGLAISQSLCNMLGGNISAESVFGQGTTFTIWLPLLEQTVPGRLDLIMQGDGKSATDEARTILIIDDDPAMLRLMQHYLGNEEWNVQLAESGQEGIRLAKKLKPSIIALDVLMPGMDGWNVLATLKNDSELAHIPVVMISMMDEQHLAFALGASEFLTKPIYRDRLISILDKYIPERHSRSVLVIEDDVVTSDMMTKLLKREGYRVTRAGNGHQALQRLNQEVPQLILLDLMMPEMDGFEFVAAMREHEEWRSIPIVVVTAKSITEEDRQRLNGYVKNIVQKGHLDRKALMHEVRHLIALRADEGEERV